MKPKRPSMRRLARRAGMKKTPSLKLRNELADLILKSGRRGEALPTAYVRRRAANAIGKRLVQGGMESALLQELDRGRRLVRAMRKERPVKTAALAESLGLAEIMSEALRETVARNFGFGVCLGDFRQRLSVQQRLLAETLRGLPKKATGPKDVVAEQARRRAELELNGRDLVALGDIVDSAWVLACRYEPKLREDKAAPVAGLLGGIEAALSAQAARMQGLSATASGPSFIVPEAVVKVMPLFEFMDDLFKWRTSALVDEPQQAFRELALRRFKKDYKHFIQRGRGPNQN